MRPSARARATSGPDVRRPHRAAARAGASPLARRSARSRARAGAAAALVALGAAHLVLAAPRARADDYRTSALRRDLERLFAPAGASPSFALYRLGWGGEGLDASELDAVEALLGRIRGRLGMPAPGKIDLFVHASVEDLAGVTGRLDGATIACVDGALHAVRGRALERPDHAGEALLGALERGWARDGGLATALGGATSRLLRVLARDGTLEVELEGKALARVPLAAGRGRVGFAVSGGRVELSDLKVREDDRAAYAFPLRDEAGLRPDTRAAWALAGERLEGASAGAANEVVLGPELGSVELDVRLRGSPGATIDVLLWHGPESRGGARLRFTDDRLALVVPDPKGGAATERSLVGAAHGLTAALGRALTAEPAAVHAAARALKDAGALGRLELPLPAGIGGSQRAHRLAALGSFALFLLEKEGGPSYRRLHFARLEGGDTPLGPLDGLEAAWRKHIDTASFGEPALAEAKRALGLGVVDGRLEPIDLSRAGPKNQTPGDARTGTGNGAWEIAPGGGLRWRGRGPDEKADQTFVRPNLHLPERFAIRAELALDADTAARLVVLTEARERLTVKLGRGGTAVVGPGGKQAAAGASALPVHRVFEVVVAFEGGGARVYVDGALACASPGGVVRGRPNLAALFVDGEDATVRSLAHREVPGP